MSNIMKIKYGDTAPQNNDLSSYELGFSNNTGTLYIGIPESGEVVPKAVGGDYIDPSDFSAKIHADTHAMGGSDPITTTTTAAINTIVSTDANGNIRTANAYYYGAMAYTKYNAATKSIDFIFV